MNDSICAELIAAAIAFKESCHTADIGSKADRDRDAALARLEAAIEAAKA